MMISDVCQQRSDVKAFKGKGEAWKVLHRVEADLRATWREMEVLAQETLQSSLPVQAPAYMQVHRFPRLAKTGAVRELRWRLRQFRADSHVLWPQVDSLMAGQSVAVRRYYTQLNQRMLDLNCQAGILRGTALRLLARMADSADPSCGQDYFEAWVKNELTQSGFALPAGTTTFHTEDTK